MTAKDASGAPAPRPKPLVFLGQPSYGNPSHASAAALYQTPARPNSVSIIAAMAKSSLLAHSFNSLWCGLLNARQDHPVTHFAMLHSDVEPENGWLNVLLDEMEATGADVLSVCLPIKDARGVLSCGLGVPGDPWRVLFRLTMAQLLKLPPTFSAADLGHPDKPLLVNTGCWIARVGPWVDDFPGFTINDRLVKREKDGRPWAEPEVEPEDWCASRWFWQKGLKVMATRKVRADHRGEATFPNYEAFGEWQFDQNYDAAAAVALSNRLLEGGQ